ncbi:MAG: hypothetical protein JOZ32_18840 [Bryobacterales bacterium]|nr:hypothetical protein [Bryobacterales bacterium]
MLPSNAVVFTGTVGRIVGDSFMGQIRAASDISNAGESKFGRCSYEYEQAAEVRAGEIKRK